MKKLFVVLLTLILSLSTVGLIGCGNTETPPPGGENPPLEEVIEGTKGLKYSTYKIGDEQIACFTGISNECTEKNIVIASHYNDIKVTEIGNGFNALSNINKVESVKVHKYVKIINSSAFNKAENLVKIEFDEGCKLEKISSSAFKNCSKLTTFNYDGSIGIFGDGVFDGCTSLPTAEYKGAKYIGFSGNPYLILTEGKDEESCIIHKDCLLIKENAFTGYKNLINVIFESDNTLTSIGNNAFKESNIAEITIPKSVLKIGNEAFMECDNLKTVTFSENSNCSIIESSAFYNCDNLEAVVNYEKTKLEVVEGSMFFKCNKLTSIGIPKTVKVIKSNSFWCQILKDFNLPKDNALQEIQMQAFKTSDIECIIIPKSVATIKEYVFMDCPANLKIYCEAEQVQPGWVGNRWNIRVKGANDSSHVFHNVYYYSETQKSGKYWRWVNGEPTPW